MVARAVSQSKSTFRGARPFNPATDLNGVAHLLEEAFRPENNFPFSNSPLLREVGIALWTLNYAPGFTDSTDGFVWIEDGQIVGNITLTGDHSRNDRYYVSNIAVKTEYRRHGVARALMQTTLDHVRQHNGRCVLLNVRPDNPGAIKLYEELGFNALETRGEWVLGSTSLRPAQHKIEGLRRLQASDDRAVSELVRAAAPERIRPYHKRQAEFEIGWDERIVEAIADFFTGQTTHRWALERAGKLAGLVFVRGQRLASPHHIVIQVHPDFRGSAEEELVARALQELERFPAREIRADATNTHPELITALERQGFRFLNGLTLMELVL